VLDVGRRTGAANLGAAISDAFNRNAQRTGGDKSGISTEAYNLVPKLCVGGCNVDLVRTLTRNFDITDGATVRDIRGVLRNSHFIRAGGERNARGHQYEHPSCANKNSGVHDVELSTDV